MTDELYSVSPKDLEALGKMVLEEREMVTCDDCGMEENWRDGDRCERCDSILCPDCVATHICQESGVREAFEIADKIDPYKGVK
jgi:methionyl-tRNA synthetase